MITESMAHIPNSTEPERHELLASYHQFLERINLHSADIENRWSEQLTCQQGCSGCCHRDLSVFPIEAERIRRYLEKHELRPLPVVSPPPITREALTVLDLEGEAPCAMLDSEGLCRIYEARPTICRSHGLPLAVQDDDGVYGDVCPLSFDGGAGLVDVSSDDFLSLQTVNTVLAALNQQFVQRTGAEPERVSLETLARESERKLSSPIESPGFD